MRIAVYLGSSPGTRPEFAAAAAQTGRLLAEAGAGVVYGGSGIGLMGVLADAGGLFAREVAHQGLTRLEIVATMHERKARMAELADAFAALPGGLGTLDELLEMLTWQQLGLHGKPVALLDVEGFWDSFLAFVDSLVGHGFVPSASRPRLVLASNPAELVRTLAS